jgi:methylated-DNA-protein-cysteine methyltransferase related protein
MTLRVGNDAYATVPAAPKWREWGRRLAKQDLTPNAAPAAAVPAGEAAAEAIRAVVARIPPGQVSSYGEIASRAGLPGRARMIGKVLGKTPDGVELPWFRVLRSDGRIAFPPQSKAYREQRARLIGEGVRVERGRVDLARFGWERNLDYALWAPPADAAPARKSPTARKAVAKKASAKKASAKKTARKPAR